MTSRKINTREKTEEILKLDSRLIETALDYIDGKWSELTRYQVEDEGTLIGLANPYIVPSSKSGAGFLFDEMYYWDSYFVAQGLLKSGHEELATGMVENMISLVKRFGIIPNANRFYFTGRSQPPCLTSYILDVFNYNKDLVWLQKSMVAAEYEYERVWMGTKHPNWRNVYHGLSRYYDINVIDDLAEAESGWDMTTRFNDSCLSYLPIDLNSLLYKYEMDFAYAAELIGDIEISQSWKQKARERADNMNRFLWDDKEGFFFDYDYLTDKHSKVWSLAGFFPLWCGLASEAQAKRMVKNLEKFIAKGGLTTTLQETTRSKGHKQWAYPNGWAPLHWIVIKGLEKYGYHELAEQIARKWLGTNLMYFIDHGVFREAYNMVNTGETPEEGLYPPQIGFGWTNAVFIDLATTYLPEGQRWGNEKVNKPRKVKIILSKVKRRIRQRWQKMLKEIQFE